MIFEINSKMFSSNNIEQNTKKIHDNNRHIDVNNHNINFHLSCVTKSNNVADYTPQNKERLSVMQGLLEDTNRRVNENRNLINSNYTMMKRF